MASNSSASGGIGFMGLLAILFIALKLLGFIAWSWWWVTAPLWAPWVVLLAGAGVLLLAGGLGALGMGVWERRSRLKREKARRRTEYETRRRVRPG